MRVLLHACCGPCLIEPYDALTAEHEVEVVYANPNIHPIEEYRRRRDTLLSYAREHGISVRELEYDPVLWMRAIAGVEDDPPARCRACFELRLRLTAEEAVAKGFEGFATTLTVSPYQDEGAIREAGERVAVTTGVRYLHRDFRDRYQKATRRSRDLGMYRQNYCGCMLSDVEAHIQREARAELRQRRAREKGSR